MSKNYAHVCTYVATYILIRPAERLIVRLGGRGPLALVGEGRETNGTGGSREGDEQQQWVKDQPKNSVAFIRIL